MKKIKFSKTHYLLGFVAVMLINIGLVVFLVKAVYAQTNKDDFSKQEPITVEVEQQKDCPIRIKLNKVDNEAPNYQTILFTLENIGKKPIRAYTLLIDNKSGGKIITTSFAVKLFQSGNIKNAQEFIERQNIKADNQIFHISFDYIEFDDGSFWGIDAQKKSISLSGEREGRKLAIKQLRGSIKNLNASEINKLDKIINQDLSEIEVNTSNLDKPEDWKKGFRLGYRSVFSILQQVSDKSIENLAKQLNEMEKITN